MLILCKETLLLSAWVHPMYTSITDQNVIMKTRFFWIAANISVYYECRNRLTVLVGRVFANGSGDLGSIPGRVIPKTLKMVLDTSLLNTQQYKVRIKGKVEQSRERSSALPYTLV